MLNRFEAYPAAVSPPLAIAMCSLIEDPNLEDQLKRLFPRVRAAVLDNERVAHACLRSFDCHRRHLDVALGIYERLSVATLDSVSDEIGAHVKNVASNKKRLRRVEKLIAKIEAPGGPPYKRHCTAAFCDEPQPFVDTQ